MAPIDPRPAYNWLRTSNRSGMWGELRAGRRYRREQSEYHPEFPVLRNLAENRHYQSAAEVVR
jgi:hypothetical protein